MVSTYNFLLLTYIVIKYYELLFFSVFSTSHGINCAGIIAAVANNTFCGVGLAYNAKIGGECRYPGLYILKINEFWRLHSYIVKIIE